MKIFEVSMANACLNLRKTVAVEGCSCSDAGAAARKLLGPEDYDRIESIVCIKYA